MAGNSYLEWLDWNPCILRSIYALGKEKMMKLDKLNSYGKKTKEKIGDYLISIGIAELGPGDVAKLTPFGTLLYDKILELEQIFVENIEDVE